MSAFARRCGVSESVMRAYLSGEKKPGMRFLVAISQACNVSVDWLAAGCTENRNLAAHGCDSRCLSDPDASPINRSAAMLSENRNRFDQAVSKVAIPENETQLVSARIRDVIGDQLVSVFARRSGLSEALIRTYIHDNRMPSLSKAASIAAAGGVTIDWLATGREPKYRKDVAAASSPEPAPAEASGEAAELLAIYRDAPPEGRHALIALAVAIRDRTLKAWLAAGQAIAETASIFDRTK